MNNEVIKPLSQQNFSEEIAQGTIIVDFWASWCGPCRSMLKIIDDLASSDKLQAGVTIGKVDIDANPDLAAQFNVMTIPTLIVFKDGKEIKRFVGVQSADTLISATQ
ncbi:MAG: thioredoxin [Victivallaceae bacterium]|nr:thioredoxin [Victivallaceae bacterium]